MDKEIMRDFAEAFLDVFRRHDDITVEMSREEAAHALQFFTGVKPTQEEMNVIGRLEITVRSHTSGKVRKLVYES